MKMVFCAKQFIANKKHRLSYLSKRLDLILGTSSSGPVLPWSLLELSVCFLIPPGLVGNLSTIFSVVCSVFGTLSGLKPGGSSDASVSISSNNEEISNLKSGLVVEEDSCSSVGLNPGGKKALTSSKLTDSNKLPSLDSVEVSFVVVFVVVWSWLNNLGGFGLDSLGLKSFGKNFLISSSSILERISAIKLVSVVVVVVDSSNLNPGGKNLDTSSVLMLVGMGLLLGKLEGLLKTGRSGKEEGLKQKFIIRF